MKAEKQRIAIAEWCGIKVAKQAPRAGAGRTGEVQPYQLPDYLNDLNAIHEAEKQLTITLPPIPHKESEKSRYVTTLKELCGEKGAVIATAAQRCEALLRTIGKWEEE